MTFHVFFRNYYANFNTIWHKALLNVRNLSLYMKKINDHSIIKNRLFFIKHFHWHNTFNLFTKVRKRLTLILMSQIVFKLEFFKELIMQIRLGCIYIIIITLCQNTTSTKLFTMHNTSVLIPVPER